MEAGIHFGIPGRVLGFRGEAGRRAQGSSRMKPELQPEEQKVERSLVIGGTV